MKRIIPVILALVMLLSFAACGEASKDLNKVYDSLMKAQTETIDLYHETDQTCIDGFYTGLNNIDLEQEVLYMSYATGGPTEVCLVEVTNFEDVDKVVDIFQARIDKGSVVDPNVDDGAEIWAKNATIQTKGNYVAMICLGENGKIPANVFDLK